MVMFAVLLMAASYLISQLTAGQDLKIIKDLGPGGDVDLRPAHRRVHRHRPGVEGSRAQELYGLLTKPVTRRAIHPRQIRRPGDDAVVNLSRDDPGVLRGAVLHGCDATARRSAGWPAPAMDPRLLIAIVLIFAELTMVTAVALFFSTFSSPLLSALLTLGLWVAGHFNADLRNFENVVDSAADRLDREGAVLRAAQPRAVRRQGRSRARHAGRRARTSCSRWRTRAVYIGILLRRRSRFSGGGISSERHDAASACRPSNRWLYVAIALLLAVSLAVQVVRDRGWQPYRAAERRAVDSARAAGEAARARLRQPRRRHLLDARGRLLRRPAPARRSAQPELRPAVSAARPGDVARSAFQGRVSLWRDLPDRGLPGRSRAGPIWPIALLQRGIEHDPERWEYMHDIGFVYYWWLRDYAQAAEWFKRAGECRARRRGCAPLAATTLAEGGDRHRRASCGRSCSTTPTSTGCAATPSFGCSSSMPWTRSTSSTTRRSASSTRERPPAGSGRSSVAASGCAAFRSIRPARRSSRSDDRPRRSRARVDAVAAARRRAAIDAGAEAVTDRRRCSWSRRCSALCIGSFLNVVIYRLPLGQSLVSPPSRCPKCGYALRWYDNIPVLSWAAARRPLPQVPRPISLAVPDRRAGHRAVVRAGRVGDAARAAAASAGCCSSAS